MSKRIVEISPSVLGADLMRLGEEIKMAESLGIHWLHLDNMDGHFAPNISFGPDFVRAIRRQTNLFLDCLLYTSNPSSMMWRTLACRAESVKNQNL